MCFEVIDEEWCSHTASKKWLNPFVYIKQGQSHSSMHFKRLSASSKPGLSRSDDWCFKPPKYDDNLAFLVVSSHDDFFNDERGYGWGREEQIG